MEDIIKPNYHFDDYFRYVTPYEFTYTSNAKERWFGKTLINLMKSEFLTSNETYYVF